MARTGCRAPTQHPIEKRLSFRRPRQQAQRQLHLCSKPSDDDGLERNEHDGELTKEERRRMLQRLADADLYTAAHPDAVGAEYGQGFVQFASRASPANRLDVDSLNEAMAAKGRLRLRHAQKPDEGFGMVFQWDGVVCDTHSIKVTAWETIAARRGLAMPAYERPQLYEVSPERAVLEVLHWTRDLRQARDIACEVATEFAAELHSMEAPKEGLCEWLQALNACNVPCALVSNFDRTNTIGILEKMGIRMCFQAVVSAEDDMETRSQQLLSAAIKLGRPPNRCIAFVSDVQGITAAHNATLRAIAVTGLHPGYKMSSADLTCTSLNELSVYNIRRLFANVGGEFMDLQKLRSDSLPPDRKPSAIGMDPPWRP